MSDKKDASDIIVVERAENLAPKEVISVEDANELRTKVVDAIDEINGAYIYFAEQLFLVYTSKVGKNDLWTLWGYDGFKEYASQELGMKKSKAYHFMQIWAELRVKLNMSRDDIAELEWTRARELAALSRSGLMTDDNSSKWLELARNASVADLSQTVKRVKREHREGAQEIRVSIPAMEQSDENALSILDYGNKSIPITVGEDGQILPVDTDVGIPEDGSSELVLDLSNSDSPKTEKFFRVNVNLVEDQYDNYLTAIKLAKAMAESDKTGHLLDLICSSFIAGHGDLIKGDRVQVLQSLSGMLESTFDMDVIFIDKRTGETLVGDHLVNED